MKQSVTFSDFTKAFHDHGRKDQFSYEALRVLFDWLEGYDEATGQETELDVIRLCCEYSEETWREVVENYSVDLSDCEDDDERENAVAEYLHDMTVVCGTTNGTIIYQDF